jgi:hypothetical protein
MKRLLITLSLSAFAVFASTAQTQPKESNPNAPEITFESETIDYGTIDQGANGERVFVFTNTGKEPLIITNTKGSCGCTVPTRPTDPIAPGEKGEIKVKYDTKRVGPFTKTVTVSSNASAGTKVLKITGVVKAVTPAKTTPEKEEVSSVMMKK